MARVLVVDDESRLIRLVSDYLRQEGHEVFSAQDGERALELFQNTPGLDLVILDVMLPRLDGWVVLREIRARSSVRVIMLTARKDERDELLGFELGVDEYVHKPFSPKLLMARVKALLRRSEQTNADSPDWSFPAHDLHIDRLSMRIRLGGQELDLTKTEFALLDHFALHPEMVFSRDRLLSAVWGASYLGEARTVDTHVKRLRSKLGPCGDLISTVRNMGYRFTVSSTSCRDG